MAKKKSIYHRLTRRHRTLLGYSQLWVASDHLLLLTSSRFAEEYKRFVLSDIQALVVTELRERTIVQFVIVLVILLWTALAATASSTFGQGFFIVTGVLFLIAAITDIARGRRCRCDLYTAVSRETLTPVRRMKTAQTFLAKIRPAIEAVQGTLPEGSPEAVFNPGESIPTYSPNHVAEPPDVPQSPGYASEILFGLLLVNAIFIPILRLIPRNIASEVSTASFTMNIAEIALALFVIFRKTTNDSQQTVRIVATIVLAFLAFEIAGMGSAAVAWFLAVAEMGRRGQVAQPPLLQWPPSSMWMYLMVGWRVVAGLVGFVTTRASKKAIAV